MGHEEGTRLSFWGIDSCAFVGSRFNPFITLHMSALEPLCTYIAMNESPSRSNIVFPESQRRGQNRVPDVEYFTSPGPSIFYNGGP